MTDRIDVEELVERLRVDVARIIAESYGVDPDDFAPLSTMCTAANQPVRWWRVYEEQAEAIIERLPVFRLLQERTRERDAARAEMVRFEAALNSREIELRTIEACVARAQAAETELSALKALVGRMVEGLEEVTGSTDGFFTVAMPSAMRHRLASLLSEAKGLDR